MTARTATGQPPTAPRGRRSLTARLLPERGPRRTLAAATFVNAVGSGMFMSSSALYFTRVVHLPMSQVAFGLFLGAMVGLAAGLLGGKVADRWGARETQLAVMIAGSVFMCCYLLVDAFWSYLVVSVLIGVVFAADKSSKAPLIRGFGGEDPAAFRAYLRASTNLAVSLGALAAGVAIQLDTAPAYLAVVAGRAVSFAGCALVLLRLPRLAPLPAPTASGRWEALRDRPYLAATVLNCLMSLHFAIPTFLLPLWIVGHTAAPRWTVSAVLVLNTVLVIGLQVTVSRNVDDTAAAGRRMRWAGIAVAAGLGLILLAGKPSAWPAGALLLTATAVYTVGELWHAAAAMEYCFGLAAPHAQGQYAGVFGLGGGVAEALAPVVLGALALDLGGPGYLVLAALFITVGFASRPLLTWAERTGRPAPTT
ncbi:Major Facilitator Superfamily protein [Streptomyces sp. 1222.5]|uniref:MFS transporter n=1 Tax=unclassified Streptomyces TaxID=2593676 RepID=UPI000895AEF9|nr:MULTISPECIES: MFS transporter [unclassified Streptomyces]SED87070.1 Major Facilitator Superfamily protein [Streptomyces sp. 1222.5]